MGDDSLAVVASYEDEGSAEQAARRLLEAGFGSEVVEGSRPGDGDGPAGMRWTVQVLDDQLVRACAVLGVEPPEDRPEEEEPKTPWKAILLIWLAAMIIVPLLAFWITVKLGT